MGAAVAMQVAGEMKKNADSGNQAMMQAVNSMAGRQSQPSNSSSASDNGLGSLVSTKLIEYLQKPKGSIGNTPAMGQFNPMPSFNNPMGQKKLDLGGIDMGNLGKFGGF